MSAEIKITSDKLLAKLDLLEEMIIKRAKESERLKVKAVRYDALQDRYLHQNEKHFGELCGNYFDDYPLDEEK